MCKKSILSILLLFILEFSFSQVGIATVTPEATLDVRAKNHTTTPGTVDPGDGILVPRVNSLSVNGTVNGQLVYLIANSGSFNRGFHYWNGISWTPVSGISDGDAWAVTGEDVTSNIGRSGSVAVGSAIPNAYAKLDVSSANQGVLIPRINLTSRTLDLNSDSDNNISNQPVGLIIYNNGTTFTQGLFFWNGSEWLSLQNSSIASGQISNLNCSSATLSPATYISGVSYTGTLTIPYTGGNGGIYSNQIIGPINGLTATLTSGSFSLGAGNLVYTITGTPTVTSPISTNFNISIGGVSCTATVGQGQKGNISEYAQVRFDALTSTGITANGTLATLLPGAVNVARVKRISPACFRIDFIVPFQDANYIVSGQPFMPAVADGDAIMPYLFVGDYTTTANPFGQAMVGDTDDGPSGGLGLEPNVHNLNLGGAVRTIVKYRTHFYIWEGYGGYPIGGASLNVTR